MTLKPSVARAIAELQESFAGHQVDVAEDGSGGVRVGVHGLKLGDQYTDIPRRVAFAITFQYPEADVYPHLVVPVLERRDGTPLGPSFSQSSWEGATATQVSRRSNNLNLNLDTAAIKLAKVLEWIRTR